MVVAQLHLHARSITEVVIACNVSGVSICELISACVSLNFPHGVLSVQSFY